jgi:hypothetical protein
MRNTIGPICSVSYSSLSMTSLQSLPEILTGPEAEGKRPQCHITTDGQSVLMSRHRAHSATCDQILLSVRRLLSEICGPVSVGRPLWRGDGSAICSVSTQWPESLRTRNHTLLSRLRLPPTWRAKSKSHYNWRSVSHYVNVSSPFCDLWPDITFCPKVVSWNLLSCLFGRPLWREVGSVICLSLSSNLPLFASNIYEFTFHLLIRIIMELSPYETTLY